MGDGVRPRPQSVRRRSASRLAAVQTHFQSHSSASSVDASSVEDSVRQFEAHFLPDLLLEFGLDRLDGEHYRLLVMGASGRRSEIDETLGGLLKDGWSLERLGQVERATLSVALVEFSESSAIPVKTIISEYTAIADSCGGDSDFVQALLDRLGRQFRTGEM